MCGCRDEGLLELNGKTYMLSLKVYETVKTDVAYVQDKTVSQIQAKDRILEYLIYNDPLGYADLILNGDPEGYLKNVTGNHGLED